MAHPAQGIFGLGLSVLGFPVLGSETLRFSFGLTDHFQGQGMYYTGCDVSRLSPLHIKHTAWYC